MTNIAQILSYLGAIQGLVLAIIVWNYPRQHKISNRILSLFIISLVYLYIGPRVLEFIDSPSQRLYYGFRTISPILLILYIHSLYKKVNLKKYLWYFLIIPLDFIAMYAITKLRMDSKMGTIDWQIVSHIWFAIIYLIFLPVIYTQYTNYKKKVFQNFSSMYKIGLKWVTQLFFGFLIIITFDFLLSIVAFSFSTIQPSHASMASTFVFTVFMYFITIKGKLSSQIYQLRILDDIPVSEPAVLKDKNQNFNENKEIADLSEKIIRSIEEHKLYKEMGLTVSDVAEKIESQPYLISQAINVSLGKNFFELINRYRVEEAKSLLKDPSMNYLSIVGIGFEAGFNSKTAFNTSFKKYTGMTPREYKKAD